MEIGYLSAELLAPEAKQEESALMKKSFWGVGERNQNRLAPRYAWHALRASGSTICDTPWRRTSRCAAAICTRWQRFWQPFG
jgi:hypothetical protein